MSAHLQQIRRFFDMMSVTCLQGPTFAQLVSEHQAVQMCA